MSISRISTNVQSMQAFTALQQTNDELGMRQLRLATGSRINRAEDDSAGYSISKKLESKVRGQAQALSNISDAKNMLTVAEGGMNSIMDIVQTMKEKVVQAGNDTLGADERTAIGNQLDALSSEINDIASKTEFNGKTLLDGGGSDGAGAAFSFQVGAGDTDTFTVAAQSVGVGDLSLATVNDGGTPADTSDDTVTSDLDVSSATAASASIGVLDTAIQTLSNELGSLGDSQKRLTVKQDNLETSKTNYEAARSGIEDADFAREQMQIAKLQILQQTGTASLGQANAAPQSVLSLF